MYVIYVYLKVKIDGLPLPKGSLVKGPQKKQPAGTGSSTFRGCGIGSRFLSRCSRPVFISC